MVRYSASYGDLLSVRLVVGDLQGRYHAVLMASGQNIIGTFASNIILRAFAFSVRIIRSAVPFLRWVYARGGGSNTIPFSPSKPRYIKLLYSPDPLLLRKHLMWNPCVSTQA